MAKQANRMMIGGFVVIAVFLLAASIVIFGSGKFFKQTDKFVLHFDGSIKGLNVGAPVLFQGVQIGSVTSIVLRANRDKETLDIPVFIEIEPGRFQVVDNLNKRRNPRETLQKLIDKGVRAVLTTQSFITGQLLIELDYYPETPVVLKENNPEYAEIPTIPSTTKRLYQILQNIDFEGLAKNLENTLTGIDNFVNNPELMDGIRSFRQTSDELRQVIGRLDTNAAEMADSLDAALDDARKLLNKMDRQVEPLAGDLKNAIDDFGKLTRNADARLEGLANDLMKILAELKGVLSEDSPLFVGLEDTLKSVSAMAGSLKRLANYLEQHPEALIQGKVGYGGK